MKNKTEIVKSVSGAMNKTMMKVRKHSPEILVVAGISGDGCKRHYRLQSHNQSKQDCGGYQERYR